MLTGLGMGVAFTSAADFTGLSPQACCIGVVEHAATLEVGEKGTVASAATAVGSRRAPGRRAAPVTFDRPYLMVVTDRTTKNPCSSPGRRPHQTDEFDILGDHALTMPSRW